MVRHTSGSSGSGHALCGSGSHSPLLTLVDRVFKARMQVDGAVASRYTVPTDLVWPPQSQSYTRARSRLDFWEPATIGCSEQRGVG